MSSRKGPSLLIASLDCILSGADEGLLKTFTSSRRSIRAGPVINVASLSNLALGVRSFDELGEDAVENDESWIEKRELGGDIGKVTGDHSSKGSMSRFSSS